MNEETKSKILMFFWDNDLIADPDPQEHSDEDVLKLVKFIKDGQEFLVTLGL